MADNKRIRIDLCKDELDMLILAIGEDDDYKPVDKACENLEDGNLTRREVLLVRYVLCRAFDTDWKPPIQ